MNFHGFCHKSHVFFHEFHELHFHDFFHEFHGFCHESHVVS